MATRKLQVRVQNKQNLWTKIKSYFSRFTKHESRLAERTKNVVLKDREERQSLKKEGKNEHP